MKGEGGARKERREEKGERREVGGGSSGGLAHRYRFFRAARGAQSLALLIKKELALYAGIRRE